MTRALITGVTGQDGTLLARRLIDEGADVIGLALTDRVPAHWSDTPLDSIPLRVGDLADSAWVTDVVLEARPNEIFNLGGQTSVAASWDDPLGTGLSTGIGALAVFEAAFRLGQSVGHDVRVVQASSAEIFGRAAQTPQNESTLIAPITPYGAAKAYAHHSARIFRDRGLFVATCILYNHESVLRPPTFVTRKITQTVARINQAGGGTLSLGNLDASRDWGWAPDYVDAMSRAIRADSPDDFVVATGMAHTVGDFVEAAFKRVGITAWREHVEIDPRFVRPAEAATQVGDPTKARDRLGWRPTVGFDEFVGLMVDHDVAVLQAST